MFEQRRPTTAWLALAATAVLIAMLALGAGCKKKPAEVSQSAHEHDEHPPVKAPAENPVKPTKTEAPTETPSEAPVETPTPTPAPTPPVTEPKPVEPPKLRLSDVIRRARSWGPAHKSWYGKEAPEFTVTDLAGKEHKLSDYRGKDVMLVFWATWCPPCRMEVPHLKELRKAVSEDRLAMLAITYEKPDLVKKFVNDSKINYDVFLEKGDMPVPFGVMRLFKTPGGGIPCSFFIRPDGTIKLGTTGLLSLADVTAILRAEWSQ
ncbi:MAG: TlpA family protein disulfide reductase [Planctomycetota bacterium]|jgi:peroxiredoxin